MNRKERRAAEKQARKAGVDTKSLLDAAIRHHKAGRLAEAQDLAQKILSLDPQEVRALQLLGIMALQTGRHAAAVELFRAALTRDDYMPACHFNLAYALHALGRLVEAETHYRRTLALVPGRADVLVNLGNVLIDQGKLDEAADAYRQALAIEESLAGRFNLANVLLRQRRFEAAVAEYERILARAPDQPLVINNLGIARREQGDLEAALKLHRRAAALDPKLAEAELGIGNVLASRGEPDAACDAFRRALGLRPHYAEAHNNLGAALTALGRRAEAADCYRAALAAVPPFPQATVNLAKLLVAEGDPEALTAARRAVEADGSAEARTLFVHAVRGVRFTADEGFRPLVRRALAEGWGRPAELAGAAVSLLRLDPALDAAISRAAATWPARRPVAELLGPKGFAAVAGDELLGALLETTPVPDVEVERFLTALRAALLDLAVAAPDPVDAGVLALACALAENCFINEYAFACGEDERAAAERLAEHLAAAAASGAEIAPLRLAAVAAYMPLHALALDALADRAWPAPVDALVTQQLREPRDEDALREKIPRLTPVEDEVSLRVKEQYEQNPYPRWITAPAAAPRAIDAYLREKFPQANFRPLAKADGLDVLIAGCGTGQHAIETTRQFAGARTLAVDLSRASLAYAARQTRALDLPIDYAEADILELEALGRSFDLIEASGVLHHLADPLGAWRRLLALLRPGGVMNVGLYSERGRAHVVRGRAFVAERGHPATAEGVRQCRQDLMGASDPLLREIVTSGDFFSLSGCRDLLFHVEEHRLTLPQIAAFIAAEGLTFLGFETTAAVQRAYHAKFPDDAAMTDFGRWHVFEQENPRAFAAMYQLWVQKP